MIFHASQYGMFNKHFITDSHGFVGTTTEDVLRLEWLETPTQDQAIEIACKNVLAQTDAIASVEAWRE